jgi:hypothetical protein
VVVVSAAGERGLPVTVGIAPERDRWRGEIHFTGQRFGDVVQFLGDVGGVRFRADYRALAAVGITPDSPVTSRLGEARLSTALKFVLKVAGVGKGRTAVRCVEEEGGVVITAGKGVR